MAENGDCSVKLETGALLSPWALSKLIGTLASHLQEGQLRLQSVSRPFSLRLPERSEFVAKVEGKPGEKHRLVIKLKWTRDKEYVAQPVFLPVQ